MRANHVGLHVPSRIREGLLYIGGVEYITKCGRESYTRMRMVLHSVLEKGVFPKWVADDKGHGLRRVDRDSLREWER